MTPMGDASLDGDEDVGDASPMSEINVTPLVDVMLVLLIIFLITVPAIIQTVPVELPKVVNEPTTTKPENVNLSIRADAAGNCEVYWETTQVNSEQLLERAVAKLEADVARLGGPENITTENMPEAHIRGDVNTPYRCIGGTISIMQSAGFIRVGFVSEPPPVAGG